MGGEIAVAAIGAADCPQVRLQAVVLTGNAIAGGRLHRESNCWEPLTQDFQLLRLLLCLAAFYYSTALH